MKLQIYRNRFLIVHVQESARKKELSSFLNFMYCISSLHRILGTAGNYKQLPVGSIRVHKLKCSFTGLHCVYTFHPTKIVSLYQGGIILHIWLIVFEQ